eukprot:PhM_4_TR6305/c0_g1_i1/m.105171
MSDSLNNSLRGASRRAPPTLSTTPSAVVTATTCRKSAMATAMAAASPSPHPSSTSASPHDASFMGPSPVMCWADSVPSPFQTPAFGGRMPTEFSCDDVPSECPMRFFAAEREVTSVTVTSNDSTALGATTTATTLEDDLSGLGAMSGFSDELSSPATTTVTVSSRFPTKTTTAATSQQQKKTTNSRDTTTSLRTLAPSSSGVPVTRFPPPPPPSRVGGVDDEDHVQATLRWWRHVALWPEEVLELGGPAMPSPPPHPYILQKEDPSAPLPYDYAKWLSLVDKWCAYVLREYYHNPQAVTATVHEMNNASAQASAPHSTAPCSLRSVAPPAPPKSGTKFMKYKPVSASGW